MERDESNNIVINRDIFGFNPTDKILTWQKYSSTSKDRQMSMEDDMLSKDQSL